MKKTVLFCLGPSGSGKSYFIRNKLPAGAFYSLKSATTRPIRPGEVDGREYYFRGEDYFDTTPLATKLWVNEQFWTPGLPKWMYGVPEFEIYDNLGRNFVYDVIEPRYARQLIDWFRKKRMTSTYEFKTLYFLPPDDNMKIASGRANMPNDDLVRRYNTCLPIDFLRAGLNIDYLVRSSAGETIISPQLRLFLRRMQRRTI